MSLFRVRDFWSLDLTQLRQHSDENNSSATSENEISITDGETTSHGQFVVSVGRFDAIGDQDVFVCGDLTGHIYVIQVPLSSQEKFILNVGKQETDSEHSGSRPPSWADVKERQLLAATSLSTTLVDLKCGFFNSALKQSIAVLSFNKLAIFTVKRRPVDLITGLNFDPVANSSPENKSSSLGENILSHDLEEWTSIDMLAGEFAQGICLMNNHADSSLVESVKQAMVETDLDSNLRGDQKRKENEKLLQAGKQVVQQLNLPQRDKIVVQYSNQFLFTLIDGKKVQGHFRVRDTPRSDAETAKSHSQSKQSTKAEYFGSTPMAHLARRNSSSLVISLSNYCLYCLPLDKLAREARQSMVNRVALDLLNSKLRTGGESENCDNLSELDLDTLAEWKRELAYLPLQMRGIQRQSPNVSSNQNQKNRLQIGQILVMSRYNLDLFDSSGEHLWHQRFEAPLICFHAFVVLDQSATKGAEVPRITADVDQIVSIVCMDSLRDGRSHLMVLKGDRLSWSAVLSSSPSQVARLDLSKMPGLIVTLDVGSGQLSASYLGTNLEQLDDDLKTGSLELSDDQISAQELVEMEQMLSKPLLEDESSAQNNLEDELRERFLVANQVEMSSSVEGVVNVSTDIRLASDSTSVQDNIVVTYEFDDLFRFGLGSEQQVEFPASGVAEVQIGICWPDQREPLKIKANFWLISGPANKLVGVAAMNLLNDDDSDGKWEGPALMPKSLKVRQYITFHDSQLGWMHQELSFLLPLTVVSQLAHLDYSSDGDQRLCDVLENLSGYEWDRERDRPTYSFCDLLLGLRCSLIDLLQEFVESDLISRGRSSAPTQNSSAESANARKIETLESINMLAQSLDWRIRYMSPSPSSRFARQSSEESVQPLMVSFALRLKYGYEGVFQTESMTSEDDKRIVWVHFCDLSAVGETSLIWEFVCFHKKSWAEFTGSVPVDEATGSDRARTSKVLISIESQRAMNVVFVLDHLRERIKNLQPNKLLTLTLLGESSASEVENLIERQLNGEGRLAVSESLRASLASLLDDHETKHRLKSKQLLGELKREFGRYQFLADNLLSLSKLLSGLPDHLSSKLAQLTVQAKESQARLLSILDSLESAKRRDVQLSKLPSAEVIELDCSGRSRHWTGFDRMFG